MAERGNVQRRGSSTNLIGRVGQTTTSLPTGTSESYFNTFFTTHGTMNISEDTYYPTIQYISGICDDKISILTSPVTKIIGYIDQKVYEPFNLQAGGGGAINYYRMRGYYTLGSVYEYWVVSEEPSLTPPSGHSLTNIVIASTWQV